MLVCILLLGLLSAASASATTFYVNSTADVDNATNQCATVAQTDVPATPGDTCTLPEAIDAATAAGGTNAISALVCGPYYITTQLPVIPAGTDLTNLIPNTDPGCTDPGALNENGGYWHIIGQATLPADPAHPGPPATFPGLVLAGAGSKVENGVIISGFTNAIVLEAPGGDHVYNVGIGSDPYEQGIGAPPNTGDGVLVEPGSANDVIGSDPADDQNEQTDIYGNGGWGVYLSPGSGPTIVDHNFIGTDTSGDVSGNSNGTNDSYAPSQSAWNSDPSAYGGSSGLDLPLGNGLGGIFVGDNSGDQIGGRTDCQNVGDTCDSNVIADNMGPGIDIAPGGGNAIIAGNDIGLSLDFYLSPLQLSPVAGQGTGLGAALPNAGAGILDQGNGDVIGGGGAGAGNLIAGNTGPGVALEGSHASVVGNLIGLNLAGTGALPNGSAALPEPGVLASEAAGVTPGQNTIRSNVIGGNSGAGIELDQAGNTVTSNTIGTGGDKLSPVPNATGILVTRGPQAIGGIGIFTGGNTIAFNTGAGVAVVDPPGSSAHTTRVAMFDNLMYSNAIGIDLGNDGPTANHPFGSIAGPNAWENFPVLTAASSVNGQFSVHGTLDAEPSESYTLVLFSNAGCDANGRGEGQQRVQGGTFTTDSQGHANFALTGSGLAPGAVLAALAIDSSNDTSEFSPCLTVGGGADLVVGQSVTGGAKVIADEPVDVDIHLANKGPTNATGIVLTDTAGSGTSIVDQPAGCPAPANGAFSCAVGSLAAGNSTDLHVLLRPGDVATMDNTVSIAADQLPTVSGDNNSAFATAVAANPNSPGTPYSIAQPTPTLGEFLRIDRVRGTVTATLPNGQLIHLRNYALVPVGTIVQTNHGVAKVTAALARAGRTSTAEFKYGKFQLGQRKRDNGIVTAKLDGSLAGCTRHSADSAAADSSTAGTSAGDAAAHAAAKSKRRPRKQRRRRLWGHDGGGNFQITGRLGVATVEGTTWEVIDTCATTTVIVEAGKVKVTAFPGARPARRIVTAGHRVTLRRG